MKRKGRWTKRTVFLVLSWPKQNLQVGIPTEHLRLATQLPGHTLFSPSFAFFWPEVGTLLSGNRAWCDLIAQKERARPAFIFSCGCSLLFVL